MNQRGNISSLSSLADERLLDMICAADVRAADAFTEIYSRHSNALYLYCRRLARQEDEANDVYQEAWIRFYRHVQGKTNITNAQAYLIRIARNVFLNNKRDDPPPTIELNENMAHYTPDYSQDELFGLIATAIELLEFDYREAFVLRFYEGLGYNEMATITGDSVSALKVRVMRAKEQIREIVAPYIADLKL